MGEDNQGKGAFLLVWLDNKTIYGGPNETVY